MLSVFQYIQHYFHLPHKIISIHQHNQRGIFTIFGVFEHVMYLVLQMHKQQRMFWKNSQILI